MMDAVKTVLSGFVGIRRKADHEIQRLKPAQVIVAGVLLAALFVLTLVAIVNLVAGK